MFLLALLACGGSSTATPEPSTTAKKASLTVYSGRSESLMGPIFERLEDELGIELDVQYGKTAEMVTRLATEGAESPADVILAQEVGHLDVLAKKGQLQKLPTGVLKSVDKRFVDPKKHWVATSGRLRVLVVDTEAVPEKERPKSMTDLTNPRWKGKLG